MSDGSQLSRDILSDITVFMKYARYIPELERRETWDELVDRNMSMHIEKYPQLKDEIEDVYNNFVRTKKVLPSMRSMQFAGRAVELNNARLYNCFGRETEFITDKGTKTFNDFEDGEHVKVMSHTGTWRDAVVKNYGQQELHTLTFRRGRSTKNIRATRNHRWIRPNGESTTNLSVGDTLASVNWFSDFVYEQSNPLERLYWAYGFVYGDGTKVKDEQGNHKYSMVRLCGADTKYLPRFEELGFSSSSSSSLNGDVMIYTGTYLKTLPQLDKDSPELIRAFIRGYLDADGAKTRGDTNKSDFRSIQSSNPEAISFLRSALEVAGVFILGEDDYTGQETNYGIRPETSRIRVTTHIGKTNSAWSLREISEDISLEDVWCLEVEEDESFVLGGGIVTGNCSYLPVKDVESFAETMFLLLSGTGVGYSVQQHHVDQLPEIKQPKKSRRFLVDDSITGWADAIKVLMRAYFDPTKTTKPIFDFRDIRKKGARLITSGGKAPGPEPLKICLTKIEAMLSQKEPGSKLTTLEAHDIQCHIADAVLSGGIRRAAMIALFSYGDNSMASCKSGAWWELNPQRGRANNSAVLLRHRMTKESFFETWEYMRLSGAGEPGFYFTNDKEIGTNPCAEISLKPYGFCNLTEINASSIVDQDDFNSRTKAASFLGTLQAGYTDFYYLRDEWRETAEKEALLGVSMTGIASGVVTNLNLQEASELAVVENERVAALIGINKARRVTTVKPSGTTSLVLGSSSGVHAWHNDYYLRRIRVNKNEAIYAYLAVFHPELVEDEFFSPETTAVITVPQKAPEGSVTRHTETAVSLLERVKLLHDNWIKPGHRLGDNTHNVSCTINIKDTEWDEVRDYIWENNESFTAISCLPHSDHNYQQAPFEDTDVDMYNKLIQALNGVDLTRVIEPDDNTSLSDNLACYGASCDLT